jgi:hypothetical protein
MCSVCVCCNIPPPFFLSLSLSLSLLFALLPALCYIHEAPRHVAVLKFPPACDAFFEAPRHVAVLKFPPACDALRLRRLESSRIALLFGGAWPAASTAGARPVECSTQSNKRCSLLCTPRFESSWGHCPQTPALPRAMPAAPSAGAAGALRSWTRGWLRL